MSTASRMGFALVSPDGVVVTEGEFTDADALAPRGGLIDQLAGRISARESEGLSGRERVKWLPFGTAERIAAAEVHGDDVVSDLWAYATDFLHNAFTARRDTTLLSGWSIRITAPDCAVGDVTAESSQRGRGNW